MSCRLILGLCAMLLVLFAIGSTDAGERRQRPTVDSAARIGIMSPPIGTIPNGQVTQDGIGVTRGPTERTTHTIDWYSLNGGGDATSESQSNSLGASVGQSVAGEASSASYQLGIGFWFVCNCPCSGDPYCDGIICNVQDVLTTIGVAFRGQSAVGDPLCPRARTDVDCTGATNIVDVTRVVNVAFRGADPATEFCDPCP